MPVFKKPQMAKAVLATEEDELLNQKYKNDRLTYSLSNSANVVFKEYTKTPDQPKRKKVNKIVVKDQQRKCLRNCLAQLT
jgi:hypothetical protein